jgi:DDE superfamily endonuclease
MALFQRLEEGLLAPGLCIFGDNAYLNTPYMATPYPGVSGGTEDAFNFYHSQLRIRIECCFGILTRRWAILRSAILVNVTVAKTVALVLALAKLHNYCLDEDHHVTPDLSYLPNDEWNMEMNGGVPLVTVTHDGGVTPQQLLNGGNHFDDLGGIPGQYNRQRRYNYMSERNRVPMPRDQLHSYIVSRGLTRPTPLSRQC